MKLPYPSTAKHYEMFRNRIRQSVPNSPITAKWLQTALAIPSEPNARVLFSALRTIGFIKEDGYLSERGQALRDSEQSAAYKSAMREAAEASLGDDCVESIRAGILNNETLPGHLLSHSGQGQSAVQKSLAGIRWLAEQAGDEQLTAAVTGSKPAPTGRASTKAVRGSQRAKAGPAVVTSTEPTPQTRDGTSGVETGHSNAAPVAREEPGELGYHSTLLESGALKVIIDSSREVGEAQRLIRMLQLVERGELVPEVEEDSSESDAGAV